MIKITIDNNGTKYLLTGEEFVKQFRQYLTGDTTNHKFSFMASAISLDLDTFLKSFSEKPEDKGV